MWSETVGLRTRLDRSETKKIGLGLAGLMLCCETWCCYARGHNDLEGHSNFSGTIYCFSILCGDQQWHLLIKVKFVKCLCLLGLHLVILVLVLVL